MIDELPWLVEQDETVDAALQVAWDRLLSRRPVLLLLLGSDLHMMQRLTAYDRPFYGRADNLTLGPLNPAEVADATGLNAVDGLDAHLVTWGLPGIVRRWPTGMPALTFLREECADPASPIFSIPEQSLSSEVPNPDTARRVLESVGGGDRTFANIAATAGSRAGALPSGTLSPVLRELVTDKAVRRLSTATPGRAEAGRRADSRIPARLHRLRRRVPGRNEPAGGFGGRPVGA